MIYGGLPIKLNKLKKNITKEQDVRKLFYCIETCSLIVISNVADWLVP